MMITVRGQTCFNNSFRCYYRSSVDVSLSIIAVYSCSWWLYFWDGSGKLTVLIEKFDDERSNWGVWNKKSEIDYLEKTRGKILQTSYILFPPNFSQEQLFLLFYLASVEKEIERAQFGMNRILFIFLKIQ